MDNTLKLVLKGQAYFLDLNTEMAPARVQMMLFPEYLYSDDKEVCRDQVILDCTLSNDLAEELRALDRRCPIAQGVTVQFEASYYRFLACYAGQYPESPPHILMLRSDLISITDWRQDSAALRFIHQP